MYPNMKSVLEELKAMRSSVDDLTASLSKRIEFVEKSMTERFQTLESAASAFGEWQPRIESSVEELRQEVGVLRKSVNRVVLDSSPPSATGIFTKPESTAAAPPAGNPVDGPNGHRHDMNHRAHGLGSVFTHDHVPVKGTSESGQPKFPRSNMHERFEHGPHTFVSESSDSHMGRLPKLPFPTFDGDNPKLWIRRSEDYFDLYRVDPHMWIKVAVMHFSASAGRWVQ
ncbi:hypothetical protein BS78_06G020200 [Paspalum vaginatum]|nr:hypothetical protein BS78_06G020200 [Paspalum vaginatum]